MRFLTFVCLLFFCSASQAQDFYMLVGTYTTGASKGIYVYRFNSKTGTASPVSNTDSAVNPSFLTIADGGKFIYAVNETHGAEPGKVSAFAFDKRAGRLSFINQAPSGGDDPCYISVDRMHKWALVANYSGGSLSALPINTDGSIQPLTQLIQDTGTGINHQRQEKPHVHTAVFSPDQKFVFYTDLGIDRVMLNRFDGSRHSPLIPATPPFISVNPGSGPRHIAFAPSGRYAYLIEELSGTVEVYSYDNGKLGFKQRLPTHPAGYTGEIGSADIHVSPDGKFLYASNRGQENSITIFSIDQANGKLLLKGFQPSMGKTPRNFVIDPSGQFLLVAHQNSDNIVIFKRNMQTGLLQYSGQQIHVPSPVCLQMMPVE